MAYFENYTDKLGIELEQICDKVSINRYSHNDVILAKVIKDTIKNFTKNNVKIHANTTR